MATSWARNAWAPLETYLLEGLTYLPGGADGLVKLTDVSGTVVGGLNWTPSRPNTAILKQSLPILFRGRRADFSCSVD